MPVDTQTLLNQYVRQINAALDKHRRDDREDWVEVMNQMTVVGVDQRVRIFEALAEDDTTLTEVGVFVSLPRIHELEADPLRAWCCCETCTVRETCGHTYALLQLLLRQLKDPGETVTRWLAQQAPSLPTANRESSLGTPAESAKKTSRLAYRVSIASQTARSVTFEACEQDLNPDGQTWSSLKPIGWSAFLSSTLPLAPQDAAVRQILLNEAAKYVAAKLYQPESLDLVDALNECDRVFDANNNDRSLRVVSGPAGMRCEFEGTSLLVRFLCGNHEVTAERGLLRNKNGASLLCLSDAGLGLMKCGSSAIADAVSELMKSFSKVSIFNLGPFIERLVKLNKQIRIELPANFIGERLAGEQRLQLDLTTVEPTGLVVRFRVKPVPSWPTATPGNEQSLTHVMLNGRVSRVVRDCPQELAGANALLKQLQVSSMVQLNDWDWRIAEEGPTIEFLARLADRQKQRLAERPSAATSNRSSGEPMSGVLSQLGMIPSTDDLLVNWPEGHEMRITSEIGSDNLRLQVEEQEDWFGVQGTIRIDGHDIPLKSIVNALKAGSNFVPLGNGLWARITDDLRARIKALGDITHSSKSGLRVDITAAPLLCELVDRREHLQLCARWRSVVDQLDASSIVNALPPAGLKADLRSYQLDGYRWLKRLSVWGLGGCLADDMGLGKTVQTLAVLLDRKLEGPTLVLAPMSVGINWQREILRFAPELSVVPYRDTNRDEVLMQLRAGDVVIVSYALFQRDAARFASVEWGTLVLDEAQNVKNATTKTARAVRDLKAKWRLALTGTPIENALSDLWSLFRAISPGVFGSWDRFRDLFALPIERNQDPERRKALARVVRPYVLRRTKSEVLKDLPPRTEILQTIELSHEEREKYEAEQLAAIAQLQGLDLSDGSAQNRFVVLAVITRLRQLACHPKLVDESWNGGSAKLGVFLELVSDLRAEGHRALVFSQFTQHLRLVREALDHVGIAYQYLDGSMTSKARQQAVDDFQSGQGELFLISLKAGGSGLNLTAADYVIHLDPWWNPAVEDQATDRAHRIGQTRPVTVYRLVTEGTIEEKILALHERKRDLVTSILAGSDEAAKLSTEDLLDLIRSGTTSEATNPNAPAPTGITPLQIVPEEADVVLPQRKQRSEDADDKPVRKRSKKKATSRPIGLGEPDDVEDSAFESRAEEDD